MMLFCKLFFLNYIYIQTKKKKTATAAYEPERQEFKIFSLFYELFQCKITIYIKILLTWKGKKKNISSSRKERLKNWI